jgi:hypothetical protein
MINIMSHSYHRIYHSMLTLLAILQKICRHAPFWLPERLCTRSSLSIFLFFSAWKIECYLDLDFLYSYRCRK